MEDIRNMLEDTMLLGSDEVVDEEETPNLERDVNTTIKDEIKTLQDVMENQGIEGVKQALTADSNKWKNTVIHVGVTGRSGAGKSAFINALRNINADDEGGAEVGVVETTFMLTSYKHPKNPNFIIWDMPGVGTPNFPKESYLECVKFDQYDFFIIISKDRFSEEDLWLANQTQERNKRFYFIRSHIDEDIRKDSRAHRKSHSSVDVISKINQNCDMNLKKGGIVSPLVFLVDSLDRENYDFGLLEAQLLKDSDSLKIASMALSLSALTKEVLQKKKEVLEASIENKAMEIACTKQATIQKEIFEREIAYYKDQFDLDDKTLQNNKDILSLFDEGLTEFKTYFKLMFSKSEHGLKMVVSAEKPVQRFFRMVKIMLGLGLDKNIPIVVFSCLCLRHNIDKLYRLAVKTYGVQAQKSLVQSTVPLGNH